MNYIGYELYKEVINVEKIWYCFLNIFLLKYLNIYIGLIGIFQNRLEFSIDEYIFENEKVNIRNNNKCFDGKIYLIIINRKFIKIFRVDFYR